MEHNLSKFESRLKHFIVGPQVFKIRRPPGGPLITSYYVSIITENAEIQLETLNNFQIIS